ncbi:hypothetical protein Hanom_Chr03g00271231 [Helianthus anomalus]
MGHMSQYQGFLDVVLAGNWMGHFFVNELCGIRILTRLYNASKNLKSFIPFILTLTELLFSIVPSQNPSATYTFSSKKKKKKKKKLTLNTNFTSSLQVRLCLSVYKKP